MKPEVFLGSFVAILGLLVTTECQPFDWDDVTPLDEYVWRDLGADDVYGYEVYDVLEAEEYTMYTLNMTSVRWPDESIGENIVMEEHLIWFHWMIIVVPKQLTITDTALLYIYGGRRTFDAPSVNDTAEDAPAPMLVDFALRTGAVGASVVNIPCQPIHFVGDDVARIEDWIIGRTWRLFLERNVTNPDINVLFPMVRAARRAADTVVDFTSGLDRGINITQFVNKGRSKRGWTAWLQAATDKRLIATVPIVLTLLNWYPNLHHHWQSYGGWSWAFEPYWQERLPQYINDSITDEMFSRHAIDPLVYNPRLGLIPKLVVSGSADEFFLPDDSDYFWDDLAGQKFRLMMENTQHSLIGQNDRLYRTVANYFISILQNPAALPEVTWAKESVPGEYGMITVQADRTPTYVKGWYAETTNITFNRDRNDTDDITYRRDFRFITLNGVNSMEWAEVQVEDLGFNTYRLIVEEREDEGYAHFWMDLGFPGPVPGSEELDELNFTTDVLIIPEALPYPRCATKQQCQGVIR